MGELLKLPNIAAKLEAQLADVGIDTLEPIIPLPKPRKKKAK